MVTMLVEGIGEMLRSIWDDTCYSPNSVPDVNLPEEELEGEEEKSYRPVPTGTYSYNVYTVVETI